VKPTKSKLPSRDNRVKVVEDLEPEDFEQQDFEPDVVEEQERSKQLPGEINFYRNSRTKMIRVHCSDCQEWMDEKEVDFENIEEGMRGEDILTFKCPKCETIQRSVRVG